MGSLFGFFIYKKRFGHFFWHEQRNGKHDKKLNLYLKIYEILLQFLSAALNHIKTYILRKVEYNYLFSYVYKINFIRDVNKLK